MNFAGTILTTEPTGVNEINVDLRSWWTMNRYWADIHGRYNGQTIGATFSDDGKVEECGLFDGIDDYVLLGDFRLYESFPFSIAGWVYPNVFPGSPVSRTILSRIKATSPWNGWKVEQASSQRFQIMLRDPSNNLLRWVTTARMWNTSWTHFAATYDGSSSLAGLAVWINGVLDTPFISNDALTGTIDTSYDTTIGAHNTTVNYFDGRIDELAVWDRVLTPDEISYLYNSGSTGAGVGYSQDSPQVIQEVATTIRRFAGV